MFCWYKKVRILHQFNDLVINDPDKACYGYSQVLLAHESQAIDSLLISDKLYRSEDFNERKKYLTLMEEVKLINGNVYNFSSMHPSGEQLDQYTGIAATLRFPMVDTIFEKDCSFSK